ncbi:MAG: D-2-hydroxyacid dehydrogenase family protein [Gemmobacter sp.]|nr:D-2-hydroxyacid dehydrogenase family protein [Gemmobacter sp.]
MRIVILDDYQRVATSMADWSVLPGAEITVLDRHIAERQALIDALCGAEVVVAMRERTPFPADLLAALPDLRLLVTTGMVNRSIDMQAARARGITVCGTPGSGYGASELAFGLVLALARGIPQETLRFRAADPRWQTAVGMDLGGRTMGIVGFGRLGREMARYARAFRMDVLAWSRSLTDDMAAEHGITRAATLDALLEQADVVSLHLPLTPETTGLVDARALGLMKPGALLVNTARGPLVDEAALIAALASGHLGGAGLDVFETEPLPADHPLRRLPNVVATPHIGYVTRATYQTFFTGAVEAIAAWTAGQPVRVLNT